MTARPAISAVSETQVEALRQAMLTGWRDAAALKRERLRLVRRLQNRHSELVVLEVVDPTGAAHHRICVKRLTRWNPEKPCGFYVKQEFSHLSELSAALTPDLAGSVPYPLFVLPDEAAVGQSFVAGVPLQRVLKQRGNIVAGLWGRGRLHAIGETVGRWLRQFQSVTAGPTATFDSAPLIARIERYLERAPGTLPPETLGRARDLLRGIGAQVQGASVPQAARHGDFTPQNIMLSRDGGIALVDVENYASQDCRYYDLTALLAYVLMMEHSPAYSTAAVRAFRRGLFVGYSEDLDRRFTALYGIRAVAEILSQFQCGCAKRTCRHRRAFSTRTAYALRTLEEVARGERPGEAVACREATHVTDGLEEPDGH